VAVGLVIGIYTGKDAGALESALTAAQVDPARVKVLTSAGACTESSGTSLHFVNVVTEVDTDAYADEMTRGTGVLPDSGGTSVPGLGGPDQWSDIFVHHGGTTKHYLSAFPVPEDEVDNFDDAIDEGRSIVLYPDPGADAPKIAAAFKAAGLQNVRSY
jgi:hypothetical protein